jgi:hypothetical protein
MRGCSQRLRQASATAEPESRTRDAKARGEYRSEYDLNRLDFQSAIKLIHLRHQNRAKAIRRESPSGAATDASAGSVATTG